MNTLVQSARPAAPSGRELARHPLFRAGAPLLVLLLADALLLPGFLHLEIKDGHLYGALVDIANRAAPLILAAIGMTLVVATRGVDISVGAVVALAGSVAAVLVGGDAEPHVALGTAFLAALAAALACGLWNGALVAGLGLQPIVATLILMVAGRGLAQLLTDGQIVTVYYAPYAWLGGGYLAGLPVALYLAGGVAVATALLLRHTALGLFLRVVGINPVAARLAGVPAAALLVFAYAFSGMCAGLAGLVISSNVTSADANNAGLLLELDAILAVTLGGTALTGGNFSLAGSVLGALTIQALTYTIYALGVPPEVNLVVKAVVVFIVCIAQSPELRRMLGKGEQA